MSLINHSKRELQNLIKDNDEMQISINKDILELIEVFSKQGHSGYSANYCIDVFCKLAKYKSLSPLTGEDSEWNFVSEGLYQNNRLSSVFKSKEDGVYDIDGIIFYDILDDGVNVFFNCKKSRISVKFPYNQKIKYKMRLSFKNIKNLLICNMKKIIIKLSSCIVLGINSRN